MSDIEILQELKEKARNRELGINSINYYYALKHLTEQKNVRISAEEEPVQVVWKFAFPHCPECGQMLPEGDRVKYCLHCGQAVKWK